MVPVCIIVKVLRHKLQTDYKSKGKTDERFKLKNFGDC